jgi:hypothetical protein
MSPVTSPTKILGYSAQGAVVALPARRLAKYTFFGYKKARQS